MVTVRLSVLDAGERTGTGQYPLDMLLTLGDNDHRCTESRAHSAKPVPRNINSIDRLLLPGSLEFSRPTILYKRDCRKKTVPTFLRVISIVNTIPATAQTTEERS